MLTARPWNKILERSGADPAAPEGADSEEERMKLKQYAAHYAVDIGAMLNKVCQATEQYEDTCKYSIMRTRLARACAAAPG
jgi:hypothetical protein